MKGTRFIMIDHDEADRKIFKRMIDSYYKSAHTIIEYNTGREAIACINKDSKTLDSIGNTFIFMEYQLPDMDGVSLLKTLRGIVGKFTPIVMLTSHGNESIAVSALKKGASDYLVKDKLAPSSLVDTINKAIERAKNKKLKQRNNKKYKLHTHYDSLTGLINRHTFEEIAKKVLIDVSKLNRSMAIMVVGIDKLSEIQNQLTQDEYNELLFVITQQLTSVLPAKSVLARYSENEFIILLNGSYVQTQLTTAANKIIQAIEKIVMPEWLPKLIVSIGVSCYPDSNHVLLLNQFSTFFSKAKKQLDAQDQSEFNVDNIVSIYAARLQEDDVKKSDNLVNIEILIKNAVESQEKASHKLANRIEFYSEGQSGHRYRELEIELGLHEAVNNGSGLSLEYQPVYAFGRKDPVALETKIIWEHPRLGIVDREEFNLIAERLNIATNLDALAVDLAAADFLKLSKMANVNVKLSRLTLGIDYSLNKILNHNFMPIINGFIDSLRLSVNSVELQLNELQLKEIAAHEDIKKLTTRCTLQLVLNNFSLEDLFLKELNSLPITSIKISQKLIYDMLNDKRSAFIVRSIAMLGKDIKVDVIADGVSNQEQYQFLIENACCIGQGSYFQQAVKSNELSHLFAENKFISQ